MADRLTELLAQNAGLGDEETALQLQMLRAKTLRDRAAVDPRRTTGKGGMFSALARGVNAYRGGTMEAEADTTRAGLDARRMELRQAAQESVGGLPSLTPEIDPRTGGYGVVSPEAITQHRALGQALGLSPVPDLAKRGAAISGEAEKAQADAAKLANLRALGLVELPDGRMVPASSMGINYNAMTGGSFRQGGEMGIINPDPKALAAAAERAKGGGSARPQHKDIMVEGFGMVSHKWIDDARTPAGGYWIPETVAPPSGALPTATGAGAPAAGGALPGATGAAPPGAPGGPKLAQRPKVLPAGEATTMALENDQFRNISMLAGSFKDDFADKGIWGNTPVAWAQFVGSSDWIPKGNQPLAEWWANYRNMVENIQRKNTSGVAVTPLEAKLFAMAQNIRPGVAPDVVRRAFQRLISEEGARLKGRTEARKAEGYTPAAVDALTPADSAPQAPKAPTGAPKYVRNPSTGKLELVR